MKKKPVKSVSKKKAPKKLSKKESVKASAKIPTIKTTLTKSGIVRTIADVTNLASRDVNGVLETLSSLIDLHIRSKGPGKFVMPGLLKITVVKKPATPARKGRNPFTGEEIMFKAKPARRVVKIRALKKLKEMAE